MNGYEFSIARVFHQLRSASKSRELSENENDGLQIFAYCVARYRLAEKRMPQPRRPPVKRTVEPAAPAAPVSDEDLDRTAAERLEEIRIKP